MKLEGVPDRIWLQYHGDADPAFCPSDDYPDASEVSWWMEPIFKDDIEYISLDLHRKEIKELEDKIDWLEARFDI